MSYHLIIPAAGQGLRAFPFTGFGTTPKPFVAMGSKTVFDYIMEEALASDVDTLSLIISERSGGSAVYEDGLKYFLDLLEEGQICKYANTSPAVRCDTTHWDISSQRTG